MHVRRNVSLLIVLVLVVALAAPSTFAHSSTAASPDAQLDWFAFEGIEVLSDEELAEVEGEFKHIAAAAVVTGSLSTINYLITTDKDDWTWKDAGRTFLGGAVTGAIGAAIGPWVKLP